MNEADPRYEAFALKLEKFITGCDATEEMGLWDKDALGEMEAYYQNDLISIIVRLISVDGCFADEEVEFVNYAFGFDYSIDELGVIYSKCKETIDEVINDNVSAGMSYLNGINKRLADAYGDILLTACDIITESDGVIKRMETDLIGRLTKMLKAASQA